MFILSMIKLMRNVNRYSKKEKAPKAPQSKKMVSPPPHRHPEMSLLLPQYAVIFGVCSILIACTKSDPTVVKEKTSQVEHFFVEPSGPVNVGIFETTSFTVRLEDNRGRPIAGAPITATFTDIAYDATLTPYQTLTNVDGEGEIAFTAPLKMQPEFAQSTSPQLEIRFQSPNHEVYVPIIVQPEKVMLTIDVTYSGSREIARIEARLTNETENSEYNFDNTKEVDNPVWPSQLGFEGLIEDQKYRVDINGMNSEGEIRATAVSEHLSPNTENAPIPLIDSKLGISGMFDITTHLRMGDSLAWTVDALLDDIQAIDAPAKAILDGIEVELSDDPFASTSFDDEREAQNLDDGLTDRLAEAIVNLDDEFQKIKDDMRASLSELTLTGKIELGKTDTSTLSFLHYIEFLSFISPDSDMPLIFKMDTQDMGADSAEWGEHDTLVFNEHPIKLKLGTPMKEALLKNTLMANLGVGSINRALENHIDCIEIAQFLKPYLADVAIVESIQRGCTRALNMATEQLEENAVALNEGTILSLKGECQLDIPDTGNQIQAFTNGHFSVSWMFDLDDIASIDAEFEATRSDE